MRRKQLDEPTFSKRLEQLMLCERVFMNPGINRDSVAAKMGTNRTSLCNYLRNTYGQTFPEYISSLRLDVIIEIFKEKGIETDIQAVAEMVGFSCYSSFYRAFTKRYGTSPKDYVMNMLTDL